MWKQLHLQGCDQQLGGGGSSKRIHVKLERCKHNRVHTFKILELLQGKMQTWYPHALSSVNLQL